MRLVLSFLTRFPVGPVEAPDYLRALGRRAPLFPLAGLIVGAVVLAVDAAVGLVFPTAVRSAAAIAASLWVTGALHLDGLMDTADGVGSGRERERMLEIMRDSRVGAMGAAAGAASLLLRYALLQALTPAWRWQALLLAPALGRMSIAFVAVLWPAVSFAKPSLGAGFATHVGPWRAAAAMGLGLGLAVALAIGTAGPTVLAGGAAGLAALAGGVRGVTAWLAALMAAGLTARFLARRLGGLTGDTYGAVNEVAEMAVLGVFAAQIRLFAVHLGF